MEYQQLVVALGGVMEEVNVCARECKISGKEWLIHSAIFFLYIVILLLGLTTNRGFQMLVPIFFGIWILRMQYIHIQNKVSFSYDDRVVDFLTYMGEKSMNLSKVNKAIQSSATTIKLFLGDKEETLFGSPTGISTFLGFLQEIDIPIIVESTDHRMMFGIMEKNYFIGGLAFMVGPFLLMMAAFCFS